VFLHFTSRRNNAPEGVPLTDTGSAIFRAVQVKKQKKAKRVFAFFAFLAFFASTLTRASLRCVVKDHS
jgi:hypothetical protein